MRALDASSLEPASLAVREPTLDDVFLSLTGHAAEETEPEDERRRTAATAREVPHDRRTIAPSAVADRPQHAPFVLGGHRHDAPLRGATSSR